MGSIARVRVHYADLANTLEAAPVPAFGASMEGTPAAATDLPGSGILVLGGESHGLSDPIRGRIRETLCIPAFGGAESLNVAAAAAILLYEIRRG